jgi:5-methylcytosine-specific restriction endonuclease McrA
MPAIPKPRPKALDKREARREKAQTLLATKRMVRSRDLNRCRICRKPGADEHHVVFRSHGGTDTMDNLVTVCRRCHEDIHGRIVKIGGTARHLKIGRWSDEANDWQWGVS